VRQAAIDSREADWSAATLEDALDPAQPIIDAHHHLYDRPGLRYLLDDYLADASAGHDIRASVVVQARSMLRADAPGDLQTIGETEFANGVRAMCASGQYGSTRVADAIVAQVNLRRGAAVRETLEAHLSRSDGHVRGIRHIVAWDADESSLNPAYPTHESLLDEPLFREGFAELGRLGLSFDAWLFFPQIPRLAGLARAFPDVPIVLDHCGGILGIGAYSDRFDQTFAAWSAALRDLAECPNVMVKLGGLGMRLSGFGFAARAHAPSSTELADVWRPWMVTCIEAFGTSRCMFESNFPVDRESYAFLNGWNAMKRVAAAASPNEKDDLFWRNAARFYRMMISPDEDASVLHAENTGGTQA
jgi:L-fuconolactonase